MARFLGIRNAIELRLTNGWASDAGPLQGDMRLLERHKGPLQMFLRPQALQLNPPGTAVGAGQMALVGGRVVDVLYSGGEVDTVIQVGSMSLFATNPVGSASFNPGNPVTVSFDSATALRYHEGRLIED